MIALFSSVTFEWWLAFYVVFACFMALWWNNKLPTTGEMQDLTTILNSRGGNILLLAGASVFFFYRAEHMYYSVVQMIKDGTIAADNGIALNGLTFDAGAFGSAFGALLKTMSPDAPSPASSSSSTTATTSKTITTPPNKSSVVNTILAPGTLPSETAVDAAKTVVDATKTAADASNPPQTS